MQSHVYRPGNIPRHRARRPASSKSIERMDEQMTTNKYDDEERQAYIDFIARLLMRLQLEKLKAVLNAILNIID